MQKIRVRYAPSPTGFLHIGNARTALFNYLFATRYQGELIIRIEDTDLARNVAESEKKQLEQLNWLGIKWNEGPDIGGPLGPYRQSERLTFYQKYTQILLDKKLAYKEYQNDNSKYVVRFKVPAETKYEFKDLIRGSLSFDSKEIEDWIIMKENGYPTYNYAVVIDDHLMAISHIFRGEEHITNTPKQMMIYQAFGWKIPTFAHISLILNEQKKKLSKRDKNVIQFIEKYMSLGYVPEALFNFLFLLGFAPKSNKTIFSLEEMVSLFDKTRFIKAPAIFDVLKLSFINSQYLKKMTLVDLVSRTAVFFNQAKIVISQEKLTKIVSLFQSRISYLAEIVHLYQRFFVEPKEVKEEFLIFIKENKGFNLVQIIYNILYKLENFDSVNIKESIASLEQQSPLKGKHLFILIRIASTLQMNGPHLPIYLELLGKETVLKNIQTILSLLSEKN
ncbi:glutamate--tRNA ligase [Vaccinium witches'-broom phytoplasma]|uniref:glutamate--tRNA ligase n=1 Tax=Vaccinium witches'-broom phytoplasma TaxID=85642 RepID=UPI00037CF93E|nr:glutamate--tRNA ligase [Vaccinium witches'-broom phytoplasma]